VQAVSLRSAFIETTWKDRRLFGLSRGLREQPERCARLRVSLFFASQGLSLARGGMLAAMYPRSGAVYRWGPAGLAT
jgi:hypothetical protein